MKKALSLILSVILLIGCMATGALADGETVINSVSLTVGPLFDTNYPIDVQTDSASYEATFKDRYYYVCDGGTYLHDIGSDSWYALTDNAAVPLEEAPDVSAPQRMLALIQLKDPALKSVFSADTAVVCNGWQLLKSASPCYTEECWFPDTVSGSSYPGITVMYDLLNKELDTVSLSVSPFIDISTPITVTTADGRYEASWGNGQFCFVCGDKTYLYDSELYYWQILQDGDFVDWTEENAPDVSNPDKVMVGINIDALSNIITADTAVICNGRTISQIASSELDITEEGWFSPSVESFGKDIGLSMFVNILSSPIGSIDLTVGPFVDTATPITVTGPADAPYEAKYNGQLVFICPDAAYFYSLENGWSRLTGEDTLMEKLTEAPDVSEASAVLAVVLVSADGQYAFTSSAVLSCNGRRLHKILSPSLFNLSGECWGSSGSTVTAYIDVRPVEPEHIHSYGEASYIWHDGLLQCTAIKTCACGNAVIETVDTVIVGDRYTADFSDAFTDQTRPYTPHTHSFGAPVFSWNGDNCTAAICCSCGELRTVQCSVTSAVTKEATTKSEGVRTLTATVSLGGQSYEDTKTESIPRLDEPGFFSQLLDSIRSVFQKIFDTLFGWLPFC